MKKSLLLVAFIISTTALLSQGGFARLSKRSNSNKDLREEKIQDIRKTYFERIRTNQTRKRIVRQQSSRRNTITYTRPSEGIFHYWNPGTQEWDYNILKKYSYDSLGRLIGEYYIDTFTNDTNNFYRTQYNENGNVISISNYTKIMGDSLLVMEMDSFVYHTLHTDFVTSQLIYNYDLISESLVLIDGYRYTFNESGGKVVSKIREYYDGINWQLETEDAYEYDMQGKLISKTSFNINLSTRDTADKHTYYYSGNTLLYAISEYWNSADGVFENNEKFDSLTFAKFDRPLSDYEIFEYDLIEEAQMQNFVLSYWDNGNMLWILANKTTFILDTQNIETELTWSGSEWEYSNKETSTKSPTLETNFREIFLNDAWVPNSIDTLGYDEFGNTLVEKYLNYNSSTQEWEVGWWSQKERELDMVDNITSETEKYWQNTELVNYSLETYTKWQTLTKEGPDTNINVQNVSFYEVKLYPNPTRNFVTIVLENENAKESTITVRNIEGKTIQALTTTDNTLIIDMGSFSVGMYFIEIQFGGKYQYFKILKE